MLMTNPALTLSNCHCLLCWFECFSFNICIDLNVGEWDWYFCQKCFSIKFYNVTWMGDLAVIQKGHLKAYFARESSFPWPLSKSDWFSNIFEDIYTLFEKKRNIFEAALLLEKSVCQWIWGCTPIWHTVALGVYLVVCRGQWPRATRENGQIKVVFLFEKSVQLIRSCWKMIEFIRSDAKVTERICSYKGTHME